MSLLAPLRAGCTKRRLYPSPDRCRRGNSNSAANANRAAASGVTQREQAMPSTAIQRIDYDEEAHELFVTFVPTGKTYVYLACRGTCTRISARLRRAGNFSISISATAISIAKPRAPIELQRNRSAA